MKNVSLNLRAWIFATSIFVLLFACNKNNDPTPDPTITLLTFKQDASTPSDKTDDWIFITDESGNVLDIEQFEADQIVILTSNKIDDTQKVNVTIFQYCDTTAYAGFRINSYLDIAPNQNWTYKKVPARPTFPGAAGTFTLEISNPPSGFGYFWVTTNDYGLSGSGDISSKQYSLLTTSLTKINISTYRDNVPVYTNLNVAVGNTYKLDFLTDLKAMEHVLSYDATGSTIFTVDILGFDGSTLPDSPQGHTFANHSATYGEPSNITVGWPDGFSMYKTKVMAVYPHLYQSYYKLGSGAVTTPFLSLTNSITNPDYRNFHFTVSSDYQLRTSIWLGNNSNTSIQWIFYSSANGKQIFSDIPNELKTKYPIFDTIPISYSSNGFTKYLDGFTYDDYVKYTMNVSNPAKPYPTEYQFTISY